MTDHISLGITGGALIALIVAVWKNNVDSTQRTGRVYQRLDEVKDANDIRYTSKEVCKVVHEQLKADIIEIKQDVKKLLTKNGIK